MRILHTMLRVRDLDVSHTFYSEVLGMKELRRLENTEGKYTLLFLGYGSEESTAVLELTYNWDGRSYDLGTAYGHLAIGVPDLQAAVDTCREKGGKVTREPGPLVGGSEEIAFIEDPDGYKIELIKKDGAGRN